MKTLPLRARVFIHCFLMFGYPGETLALVVHILHQVWGVNSKLRHSHQSELIVHCMCWPCVWWQIHIDYIAGTREREEASAVGTSIVWGSGGILPLKIFEPRVSQMPFPGLCGILTIRKHLLNKTPAQTFTLASRQSINQYKFI